MFLPPVSGTADVFFRQILTLSTLGFRVIAVDSPAFWTVRDWCLGFRRLLDHLQLDLVHLFGASLGGFLAQKFAEMTHRSQRVGSLILCNTFNDTTVFGFTSTANTFWMMPSVVLKKMVISGFDKRVVDADIADAIDFMVDKLDSLSQETLASRLTLNCLNNYVEPQRIHAQNIPVTIIDVFDEAALSTSVSEELAKCFPEARLAHLKSGGNFPFLSRSDEVNILIRIHLQPFAGTRYAPYLPSSPACIPPQSLPATPPSTPQPQYTPQNSSSLKNPPTTSTPRSETSDTVSWTPESPQEIDISKSNMSTKDLEEWDSMMEELESNAVAEEASPESVVTEDIAQTIDAASSLSAPSSISAASALVASTDAATLVSETAPLPLTVIIAPPLVTANELAPPILPTNEVSSSPFQAASPIPPSPSPGASSDIPVQLPILCDIDNQVTIGSLGSAQEILA